MVADLLALFLQLASSIVGEVPRDPEMYDHIHTSVVMTS